MKDIYSPLEIDEQWDQRAPMSEGDTAAMNTFQPSSETGAATATMEPMGQASDAIPGVEMPTPSTETPTADTNTNEVTDEPHIELHGDAAHAEMDAQATMQQAEQANDDDAIAKLSGDHLSEEATTDPNDSAMNPKAGESVMATQLFTPAKPREQGVEKTDPEAQSVEVTSDATEETPATDTNEHFVLGSSPETEKEGDTTPEPEVSSETEAQPSTEVEPNDDPEAQLEAMKSELAEAEDAVTQAEAKRDEIKSNLDAKVTSILEAANAKIEADKAEAEKIKAFQTELNGGAASEKAA